MPLPAGRSLDSIKQPEPFLRRRMLMPCSAGVGEGEALAASAPRTRREQDGDERAGPGPSRAALPALILRGRSIAVRASPAASRSHRLSALLRERMLEAGAPPGIDGAVWGQALNPLEPQHEVFHPKEIRSIFFLNSQQQCWAFLRCTQPLGVAAAQGTLPVLQTSPALINEVSDTER